MVIANIMTPSRSRRQFGIQVLKTGIALTGLNLTGSALQALEPFNRPGKPRLSLGLAAYSFRDYFNHKDPDKRIDMFDFIDFCADNGCDGGELTSYYFPKEVTQAYLVKLRRKAFLRGIEITGTAIGNRFTLPSGPELESQKQTPKDWINHAVVMGAPHIRVFAGSPKGVSVTKATQNCVDALKECADYAGERGIFLGLENHGGIVATAEGILNILHAVDHPWLGINLDTGNFHTADPYRDLERCAPFAVNVQLKGEIHIEGKDRQPADISRLIQILRKVNYQGYVTLEYELREDPYSGIPPLLQNIRSNLATPA